MQCLPFLITPGSKEASGMMTLRQEKDTMNEITLRWENPAGRSPWRVSRFSSAFQKMTIDMFS
jgi:hypothetical protein